MFKFCYDLWIIPFLAVFLSRQSGARKGVPSFRNGTAVRASNSARSFSFSLSDCCFLAGSFSSSSALGFGMLTRLPGTSTGPFGPGNITSSSDLATNTERNQNKKLFERKK